VVFAYIHSQQYTNAPPALRLRGLDEKALYKIRTTDDRLSDRLEVVSGAYLMNRGLNFSLRGDYDATAVILERQ
jgi:alpha-galactosidase